MEVVVHRNALFFVLHESYQPVGDRQIDVQCVVNRLFELGRVSRFEKDTCLSGLQLLLQCAITASTVRVEDIARGSVATFHALANHGVGISRSADDGLDGPMITVEEGRNAGEVRGGAYVHGVGQGLFA